MKQRTAGRTRREVAEVLEAVCRGEVLDAPAAPPQAVADAARHHRIAPLAHVRLRQAAPATAELLREDRDRAKGLHIRASMLLSQVAQILEDIPWVVFKGPVLSERAHPVPGLRPYGDLDLLVAPQSLREVSEVLLDAGWVVGDYEDMLRNPQTPGEMHWFTPAGIPVDLHWSMINMASRRRLFTIATADLLSRRRSVRLGLGAAWAMDEADALVHVCLHATLAGANKLGWMLDVDQLARQVTTWDEVARRAVEWGAHAQVALALRRSTATLGTPVPDSVYRGLGTPAGLRVALDLVDRARPVARERQEASVARLVARAVRPGAVRTLAVVTRNATQGVLDRVRPTPSLDPADRVQADAAALEAYLTAVEAQYPPGVGPVATPRRRG